MNRSFPISLASTLLINIAIVVLCALGSESDMCNPGAGILFGFFIFVPLTLITLVVSGVIALVTRNMIARGIAVAELVSVLMLLLFILLIYLNLI